MPEEAKNYEISFLLLKEEAQAEVEKTLVGAGAETVYKNPLAQARLAYPIRKQTSAYFGFMHFKAMPDRISQIKSELGLKPDVLRFLIVTPPFTLKQPERKRLAPQPVLEVPSAPVLSNEELEQKLEEILK